MTVRHLMWASLATGLIALMWLVGSLSDPAYYDPQTVSDYLASALAEIMLLAIAYSLIVWWRVTPVRRGALMLPGAAVGFVLWSVGNDWKKSWVSNSVPTSSSSERSLRTYLSLSRELSP